ncbi:hypothetical protein SteCoe_29320 [Stentor coeruleus]|uniref:EF-hand domain-containing protein n=1 Tax=Stentor coeruleus TaxID=5963 RepID=A0A1R2B676_9CILI|nr:hypothetical protein SteCoe_29320 [Stentor coeruleus]
MINYNSIIDSFSSRPHYPFLSYSAMKRPTKSKLRHNFLHESIQNLKPDEIIPPLIPIKKPLNISPRRITNINLRLPNLELRPGRNFSVSPISDNINIHSLSMEIPHATIIPPKLRFKQSHDLSPKTFIKASKIWKNSSSIHLAISSKTNLLQNSGTSVNSKNLYENLTNFLRFIESKYKKTYEEIDISQKGYVTVDDFINLLMFINLVNLKSVENFDIVRTKAEELFAIFYKVSSSNKVTRKDFYAVCSLYEFGRTEPGSLNVLDERVMEMLKEKAREVEEVFLCYAKTGRIKIKDLHNVLYYLNFNDIHVIEGMLYLEVIDFSCFLRFLPLFSWIHYNVTKNLENNPQLFN